jgi:hypothetical protein
VGASSWVHLDDVAVMNITERAVLILYDGVQHWIPKSQIDDPDRLTTGDGYTLSITEWIAD